MKRMIIGLVTLFLAVILIIPGLIALFGGSKQQQTGSNVAEQQEEIPLPAAIENQISVSVYRAETEEVQVIPIEEYIAGVISGEMPADFELEALKAQALAARTYIIRRLAENDFSDVPKGAHVTDTIQHQVYRDQQQQKESWGSRDFDWKIRKIRQAVVETKEQVLTYEGKPIDATFFSTSNGFTENSEEYWAQEIPYLRSVAVPWDQKSPKYKEEYTFTAKQLEEKLGFKLAAPVSTGNPGINIVEKTTGNRAAKIKVGDQELSGRQFREKLDLPSSAFEIEGQSDGSIKIKTFGYGHGVGMSQWGAHGMAREGKTATDIVQYFYQGIAIESYHQWVQ
ncbi:stage II sporulation protein D [Ammoniphilus oxalaticus]|uniref:Stage II sporulation protein D n=1 Tax=Ammoniphilus oxalaticus TaxID=66863 RepID=A0A419SH30_9BACL|nr:stage II sporulation protein D [Ammoniphilus oxalaticus]RKD23090.1 stage II sporulation protein D [Ammoniphilus oxalaticus]